MSGVANPGLRRFRRVLTVVAVVLGSGVATAEAASINVSWTAPTTNVDGSPLTNLAGYRLYVGTTTPVCPGPSFHAVDATSAPSNPAEPVHRRITGLIASATYVTRVTAVDTSGTEGPCSAPASGVARGDITVTPATPVDFGSLAVGTTAERTFTVRNTSTAAVAGTARVGAPFAIASGGSFFLAPGASQPVVVRFSPTSAGSFTTNVSFSVGDDTTSLTLSGSTTGSPDPGPTPGSSGPLRVFLTDPPRGAAVGSSGAAVVRIDGARGSSNRFTLSIGGIQRSSLTTSSSGPLKLAWTGVPRGTHTISVTVRDATGRTGTTSSTVVVGGGQASPPPRPAPPSGGALRVYITEPNNWAFVDPSGSAVLRVEGATGAANTFTLSVDGVATSSITTSTPGPVRLAWAAMPKGRHTLAATVRDASGRTGRTSIIIRVLR
jgi:hypothetical protein